jgi:hypothetical protein
VRDMSSAVACSAELLGVDPERPRTGRTIFDITEGGDPVRSGCQSADFESSGAGEVLPVNAGHVLCAAASEDLGTENTSDVEDIGSVSVRPVRAISSWSAGAADEEYASTVSCRAFAP